jgi:DNA-binding NarL/FixJ family response regulator
MAETTYIALVDDHVLLRTGLANLINNITGYRVLFEADNGLDFIKQIKPRHAPDIVLLDITMPQMNGYETAQWIRINLPESKVLVLSMMENDLAIIKMLKLGAKGFILKDSKPKVFIEALNGVRDTGFYLNDLVNTRMLHYVNNDGESKKDGRKSSPGAVLTEREMTFLKYACTEKSHKEIAAEMFVSPRTIDSYRDSLFEKLGVTSRVGLVLYAIKNGIVII